MAIKTESVNNKGFKGKHIRLDPTYYILKEEIKKMQKVDFLECKTLDEHNIEVSSGSYVDNYLNKETGVKYLRVGNIKPYSINESERNTEYVSNEVNAKNKVCFKDVILGRTQATTEKLAVASIIDENSSGSYISQHVSKLNAKNSTISPEFLVSYLNSDFYIHQLKIASHGDTRVELTHSQLKELLIFLPDKKTVKKIEENVSEIFSLNKKANALMQKAFDILKKNLDLQELKNYQSFSLNNSKLFNADIWNPKCNMPGYEEIQNEIISKHETIQLSDKKLFEIRRGKEVGSINYKVGLEKSDSDIAFIRTSDVINYEIDLFPDYFVDESFQKMPNLAKKGDIIFSRDGVIGETAMICEKDKALIASGFYIISKKEDLDMSSEYFFTCMSSHEIGKIPALMRTVYASTIPHLQKRKKDTSQLQNFYIPILSKDAQDEITDTVKKAFDHKNSRKQIILKNKSILDSIFKKAI